MEMMKKQFAICLEGTNSFRLFTFINGNIYYDGITGAASAYLLLIFLLLEFFNLLINWTSFKICYRSTGKIAAKFEVFTCLHAIVFIENIIFKSVIIHNT